MTSFERLRILHWLPVSSRIDFKVCLLTLKALTSGQPEYLHSLLSTHIPSRSLRSGSVGIRLMVPRSRSVTASRAFSVHAPFLWNSLSLLVRALAAVPNPASVACLKTALKTRLYSSALDPM